MRAEFFAKLMKFPFVVMRKTDSDAKGMMGRLYDLMLQLTEDIRDFLDEHAEGVLTRGEVGDIWKVVQDRKDNGLACDMHVVGRILNPTNQEEGIFLHDLECTRIFKKFVSKHFDDQTITTKGGVERRASLIIQEGLIAFINLTGCFGMPDAIADRAAVKEGKMTAPNGTATGHNGTGVALLQSHKGLYSLYTALCPLIVLLWWMDVTQGQVREWLRLWGSVVTAKPLKLKRAAASFMCNHPFILHRSSPVMCCHVPPSTIMCSELGSARMKIIMRAVVVGLSQRAGTDLLQASMEIAEKRISTLERHLEDSRKELEERERMKAELSELRRQV
ncbi:unnamed protein product [Closterium sp. NIES-65]|nr:unnamed protein product [Closterium sp. NIES-65]